MSRADLAAGAAETVEVTELITPVPAAALAGLLDVAAPDLSAGERLPPLWHWVYLCDRPSQASLGPDGHRARGGIPLPPGPGRRRMFAGGRVRTAGTLVAGEPATRRTFVRRSARKAGRTGALTFVTVAHEISQRGRLVIDEEQDIVYRDAAAATHEPAAGAPPEPGPVPPGPGETEVRVDPVLLFRFSALTYNAHRIHYDRDYAVGVEGYSDLVVHGPLQAILMAGAAFRTRPPGAGASRFEYRLLLPLLGHQGLVVFAGPDGAETGTAVRDRFGRRTASGRLGVAECPSAS